MEEKIEVFLSYAHRDKIDKILIDKLAEHLSLLKRHGLINIWHDRDISAGTEWQQVINTHLNTAHLILLLISPAFLASDYCYSIEMKRAVERHEAGEACVIPIILRPVDWRDAPFGKLQALPPDALPITMWRNRDKAFFEIAQGIRKSVEELAKRLEIDSYLPKQVQDNSKRFCGIYMNNENKGRDRSNTGVVSQQQTRVFGIDLGTSYSCISYVDEYGQAVIIPSSNGDRVTPSVVLFEGENRIVGKEAKNRAILQPEQTVAWVKRHMGSDWHYSYNGSDYTPEEISSYILRKLADDAERHLGYPVNDVVITCPAYFGIAEREATVRAGEIAGFNVRAIINEPTAAAIMYGLQNEPDQVVLVYDLGGGTFDITVIEIKNGAITVITTGGDHNLGGHDWDSRIVIYLVDQWQAETKSTDDPIDSEESLQDLWQKAESIKLALTMRRETTVIVTHVGQGVRVTLTRDLFNELTANLLERTIDLTESVIGEARSLGLDHFDQILLVGGSTRMPQISERLKAEFDLPLKRFDPDEAVAKGAAVYGQKLAIDEQTQIKIAEMAGTSSTDLDLSNVSRKVIAQAQKEVTQSIGLRLDAVKKMAKTSITNVSSHSFGIIAIKEDQETGTQKEVISNLVLLNHSLPTSQSRYYRTLRANQEMAEIKIMENSFKKETVEDLSHGEDIGNVVLQLPPRLPAGSPIEVTFELDAQGRLHVIGREPSSGTVIEASIHTKGGISETEFIEAKDRINKLIVY